MSVHQEKVLKIIREQFGLDDDQVSTTSNLVDDIDMDSLDQVELLMAFEDEFGVEIPDADFEPLVTVQQLIDYIERRTVPPVPAPAAA